MKKQLFSFLIILLLTGLQACQSGTTRGQDNDKKHPILSRLTLPPGFHIGIFADNVENARSLCQSPDGVIFVGTRVAGNVYALKDEDGDYQADRQYLIASGLNMPNGVAFRDGDLYVAEVSRILVFRNILDRLDSPPEPEVFFDGYPTDGHHGWKYIAFGPDGKLYVPVGAPCNVCLKDDPVYATITRIDPVSRTREIVCEGVRNSVGMDWDPIYEDLWFTDNGRDHLGDDLPADELNWAPVAGKHFGFPYCHQGDLPDPEFGHLRDCSEFRAPVKKLGPHVAALGMEFYRKESFPKAFQGHILLCEHGSWNRSKPIGYRVSVLRTGKGGVVSYEPFIKGWLQDDGEVLGRPVDLETLADGSVLISDDYANMIYRVYYDPAF